MFYLFVIIIVLWIVGASVYSLFQWLKKRRGQKKEEQDEPEEQNGQEDRK